MSRIKRFICFTIISILAICLDQLTKAAAVKYLMDDYFPFIKNILEFVYTENRGAAFGILQGGKIFFYIVAIIVSIVIIRCIYIMPDSKRMLPLMFSLNFIFAGAWGNIIDRIYRSYVVDFIYFKPINFPVFNVADIYVSLAVVSLMFLLIFYYKEDEIEFLSFKGKNK